LSKAELVFVLVLYSLLVVVAIKSKCLQIGKKQKPPRILMYA